MSSGHNSGFWSTAYTYVIACAGSAPLLVHQSGQPLHAQSAMAADAVSFAPGSASPHIDISKELLWQDLLVAARVARDKGSDQEARQLYNLALSRAKGVPRSELVQFLRINLWA